MKTFVRNHIGLLSIIILPFLSKILLISKIIYAGSIYHYAGITTVSRGKMVPGVSTLDPNAGYVSEALGHAAAVDILGGLIPWWNFYQGVGGPLAGDMQSAALFPLNVLLYFPGGQLYIHILLQILAGLSTFFFLRKLGLSSLAATIAGIVFEFNGTFSWLANAVINPIPFLPLILLGIETIREHVRLGRSGGWFWVSAGLALSLYAGFPEVAYLNGLFVFCWTVARLNGLKKTQAASYIARSAVGAIAGLFLAAPILIAFLDFLSDGFVAAHQGAGFLGDHLPHYAMLSVALPYVFGFLAQDIAPFLSDFWGRVGGYAGTGLLVLACSGAFGRNNRHLRVLLAGWILLAMLASYGAPGTDRVLDIIPGFGLIAYFRYLPPSWEFALVILAAFAIDDISAHPTWQERRRAIAGTACFIVGAAILLILYFPTRQPPLWFSASILGSCLVGACILAVLWIVGARSIKPPRRAKIIGIICVGETMLYFLLPTLASPRRVELALGSVAYLKQHSGLQRFYSLGPIQPNYGAYFGISSVNHNDLPLPNGWVDYVGQKLDGNSDPVAFNGYNRLTPNGPSATDNLIENLHEFEAVGVKYVLTLPNALSLEGVKGIHRVFADKAAIIYELPDPRPYFSADNCVLRIIERNRLIANCDAPAKLLRLEYFMVGWQARVNGTDRPIVRTEQIFQQIDIPAGHSEISFSFTPPFMTGGYIAFAAGLLLSVTGFVNKRRTALSPTAQFAKVKAVYTEI